MNRADFSASKSRSIHATITALDRTTGSRAKTTSYWPHWKASLVTATDGMRPIPAAKLSSTVSGLNQNREHIYASLDAVRNSAGQIVCRITITNPTVQPGCIPINAFGPTAASEAAVSYWFDTITQTTENTLDGLAASLTGSPLNSWAGPIDMALSAELRKLEMSLDSDSRPD